MLILFYHWIQPSIYIIYTFLSVVILTLKTTKIISVFKQLIIINRAAQNPGKLSNFVATGEPEIKQLLATKCVDCNKTFFLSTSSGEM